jgi:hypothetical protein
VIDDFPTPHEAEKVQSPPEQAFESAPMDMDQPFYVNQTKRQALDMLFTQVLSGAVERSRPLKSWEPDYLDERHLQIIMLRAANMDQGTIAKMTGFTESWVSIILNHPDAQYVLTKIISFAADSVIDMQARIKAVAPEALTTVVEVMRTSRDDRLRSANAFELLKMAGYGAVEKKQVSVSTTVPAPQWAELTQAIKESQNLEVSGQYRIVPGVTAPVDGARESTSTPADSGPKSTGEPPISGSQVAVAKVA